MRRKANQNVHHQQISLHCAQREEALPVTGADRRSKRLTELFQNYHATGDSIIDQRFNAQQNTEKTMEY